MSRLNAPVSKVETFYHEESITPPILVMSLLVIAIASPLVWFNYSDLQQSARSADVSKYRVLAGELQVKTEDVRRMFSTEAVDESLMTQVSSASEVTLITPDSPVTNEAETVSRDPSAFSVKLKAIYWNPVDPLVTIEDENYKVGEKIHGFTIVEIRKTAVIFRSPLGEQVIKYFYDYLDKPKRN